MRRKLLPGLFLALLLTGTAACGGGDTDGGKAADGAAPGQEKTDPEVPRAELGDVPAVVAEVNGEDIPRSDFVQAYEMQLQQATAQAPGPDGLDRDRLKQQVAQSLISTELLVQEADQRDIAVSDRDVEQTLQGLAAQNGTGTVDAFVKALEQQGMSRAEVDRQVRSQVKIERLVADEAGDVEVSAKEARALYDQMVAQQEQSGQAGQSVPPFRQVRQQVEQQLKAQKHNQVAQRLVADLREDAEIVLHI